jgi:hypothetical protein
MSINKISFWQQNQLYRQRSQERDQELANSSTLMSVIGSATTNRSTGLSSIANQTALNRVNTALSAALQSILNGETSTGSDGSSSSSSGSSSSSSTSSTASPLPASGAGTVPLTKSTSLFTLGFLKNGTVTVNDGTNTTTYTSTGSDTVGDLINAFNAIDYGNANVTAQLDSRGRLVITAKDASDNISIGGLYASNIGFGVGNTFFQPIKPASDTSTGSGNSSSDGASGASSSSTSTTSSSASSTTRIPTNSSWTLQTFGTAQTLLASNGLSGSLIDMLT